MRMFLQNYCRASVARKEHKCIACSKTINIGELFMRFIPRFMANEIIHIECYAYDNKEPFLVSVDYKRYVVAETVLVRLETLNDNINEIRKIKGLPIYPNGSTK